MTLSKFLEIDHSASTIETEESSSSSFESSDGISASVAVQRKTVRFATTATIRKEKGSDSDDDDDDDDVLCVVHLMEKHDDPDLWWQEDEVADTRVKCFHLVKSKTQDQRYLRAATVHFLQRGSNSGNKSNSADLLLHEMKQCPDERGLEFYIVRECSKIIQYQHKNVFDVQSTTTCMAVKECRGTRLPADAEGRIRGASIATSEAFVDLALLRARYDAEEAERVYRKDVEEVGPLHMLPYVPSLE